MSANEPILKRELGLEGSGIGISGKIPTGMRATAVRSNEIVGVAGFLYPGSRVDVLVTYTPPTTSGGGSGPLTQTVLQNVEVLTAGQTIEPDPQGKPQTVNVVTLLVSPEDSQKLQLASSQGTVQFVLRSGVDQKNVELRPTQAGPIVRRKTCASGRPGQESAPESGSGFQTGLRSRSDPGNQADRREVLSQARISVKQDSTESGSRKR